MQHLVMNRFLRTNLAQLLLYMTSPSYDRHSYKNKKLKAEIISRTIGIATFIMTVLESDFFMELLHNRSEKHRNIIYGWGKPITINQDCYREMMPAILELFSDEEIDFALKRIETFSNEWEIENAKTTVNIFRALYRPHKEKESA